MKPAHPNVLKAIADMEGHLKALRGDPEPSTEEKARIRRDAVTTHDLMNYSYEVADTKHPKWKELEHLVRDVLSATSYIDITKFPK